MHLHRLRRPSRRTLTTALALAGALAATGMTLSSGAQHSATARTGAQIGMADSSGNGCSPGTQLPIVTGGVVTLPGSCTSVPNSSIPQGLNGQQGQDCQLTEAQQQELIARAQDQQAALDLLFQSELLKNLLALESAKAAGAALSAQLAGHSGLRPQDVATLIQNGSVTPGDLAAAILQTLQELGESSGDTIIDTCAGIQDDGNNANTQANSSSSESQDGQGQNGSQDGSAAPGVNVPADPLAAAADRNVDLGKIEPKDIVWRTDNDTLYREDARSPKEIHDDGGFRPKDVNGDYNLNNKVSENNDGPYVSTTRDATTDVKQNWYLYKIEAPGGIDLEISPGVNQNAGEDEVVFPGGIDLRYVVGAWEYTFNDMGAAIQPGTWIDAKDFGN